MVLFFRCYNCLQIQKNDPNQGTQQHRGEANEGVIVKRAITKKYPQIKDQNSLSNSPAAANKQRTTSEQKD